MWYCTISVKVYIWCCIYIDSLIWNRSTRTKRKKRNCIARNVSCCLNIFYIYIFWWVWSCHCHHYLTFTILSFLVYFSLLFFFFFLKTTHTKKEAKECRNIREALRLFYCQPVWDQSNRYCQWCHHCLASLLSPFSLSFGDFGTKFWFVARWDQGSGRSRFVSYVSGNDWNGTPFPVPTFDIWCMFVLFALVLGQNLWQIQVVGKEGERERRKNKRKKS